MAPRRAEAEESQPHSQVNKPSEDCHFLRIPPELRLKIYELAFDSEDPQKLRNRCIIPHPYHMTGVGGIRHSRPALLGTCRLIRIEAMSEYYRCLLKHRARCEEEQAQSERQQEELKDKIRQKEGKEDTLQLKSKKKGLLLDQIDRIREEWKWDELLEVEGGRMEKEGFPVEKWVESFEARK